MKQKGQTKSEYSLITLVMAHLLQLVFRVKLATWVKLHPHTLKTPTEKTTKDQYITDFSPNYN